MNLTSERIFSKLTATIYFASGHDLKNHAKAGRKLESIHSFLSNAGFALFLSGLCVYRFFM